MPWTLAVVNLEGNPSRRRMFPQISCKAIVDWHDLKSTGHVFHRKDHRLLNLDSLQVCGHDRWERCRTLFQRWQ